MCPRPTRRTRRSPPLKSRSTERSAKAVGREMTRSAVALADVEQEAVRWALAISAVLLLAETWSLDLYPFLPQWAPTILDSVAEAALTLLIG